MTHLEMLLLYSLSLGTNKLACVNLNARVFPNESTCSEPISNEIIENHVDNSYDNYGFMNPYGDEKRSSLS